MYIGKHYSGVNDRAKFRKRMLALRKALPALREQYGISVWFVSGKSGIVAQAALAVLGSDEPVCSIRKPGEKSHGDTFEGNCDGFAAGSKGWKYGIIDDFVASGSTVDRMMGQIEAAWEKGQWEVVGERDKPALAAIVRYQDAGGVRTSAVTVAAGTFPYISV